MFENLAKALNEETILEESLNMELDNLLNEEIGMAMPKASDKAIKLIKKTGDMVIEEEVSEEFITESVNHIFNEGKKCKKEEDEDISDDDDDDEDEDESIDKIFNEALKSLNESDDDDEDDDEEDDDDDCDDDCEEDEEAVSLTEALSVLFTESLILNEGSDGAGNYIKKLNVAEIEKKFGKRIDKIVASNKKLGNVPLSSVDANTKELINRFADGVARRAASRVLGSAEKTLIKRDQKINKFFKGIEFFKVSGVVCFCVNTNKGFTRFMYIPFRSKDGKKMLYRNINLITLFNKKYNA